jgi:penicillin-binding protein 2
MASNDASSVLRLTFLSVLVIALFLALVSRLWFLQVLAGDRYVELADSNRLRTVVTEAPRGSILAADGSELVRNRPALAISADRQVLLDAEGAPVGEEAEQVIERLSRLLQLDTDEVRDRMSSRRYSPFRPVPIAFDVAPEIVFSVRENQELFPGIVAETLPVREYPQGNIGAHLVGYLGEIGEAELATEAFADYRGGDLIGRAGLEQVYEQDLRGTVGQRILVVNARGNVIDVQSERDPIQGDDLVTTIDLDLQRAVEQLLQRGIESSREIRRDDGRMVESTGGSAIVLDVDTGAVLAMASYPTYDPREFVGGVDPDYWTEVNSRENFRPLFNRPIAAQHPPGSVFKIVSGAAMVEAGLIGPRDQLDCPAAYEVGNNTFRNWNTVDEGAMDLSDALKRSCDTYFYDLALRQWQVEQGQDDPDEVLVRVAERFGHGVTLGIDLPGEQAGTIPGREWRYQNWLDNRDLWCSQAEAAPDGTLAQAYAQDNCEDGGVWRGGDAINSSIGQGDVATTPLQVVAAYQALANDGVLMRPHLGDRIVGPDGDVIRDLEPEVFSDLGLDDSIMTVMHEGLVNVVADERGTAVDAFEGFPHDEIGIAGKTGTAEAGDRIPFAWFAGYAPADAPEIAVVVNVEEGSGGGQTAAPIVRNIVEHHFGIVDADEAEFQVGAEIYD